jgi:hypothetical protein
MWWLTDWEIRTRLDSASWMGDGRWGDGESDGKNGARSGFNIRNARDE